MSWFEIIYEVLQYSLIAYFASHAYRNSQDVSDLKAKMITLRGRFEYLEGDYNLAARNRFYADNGGQDTYIRPNRTGDFKDPATNLTKEN